jgi:hypothetical protein
MIVYCSTDFEVKKVYSDLQKKRTNENAHNFLSCPAVRDGWHNVFMFSLKETSKVVYNHNSVHRTNELPVWQPRKSQLKETNTFNLQAQSYLFCEESVKIKLTAPYFHEVSYQSEGTFVGGIFDIGRWFRAIECEIITWKEKGEITFTEGQPLFYVEFLIDSPITLQMFDLNPSIKHFSNMLTLTNPRNIQGSLDGRYQGFENSNIRKALVSEIRESAKFINKKSNK